MDRAVEQVVAGKARDVGARRHPLGALQALGRLVHGQKQTRRAGGVHHVAERLPFAHKRVDAQVEQGVGTLVSKQEGTALVLGHKAEELRGVVGDALSKEIVRKNRGHQVSLQRFCL